MLIAAITNRFYGLSLVAEETAVITGAGFGTKTSKSRVSVQGSPLSLPLISWSDTRIEFQAPAASTLQPLINPLNPLVALPRFTVSKNDTDNATTLPITTLVPPPRIDLITPLPVKPGQEVTVGIPEAGSKRADFLGMNDRNRNKLWLLSAAVTLPTAPSNPLSPTFAWDMATYLSDVARILAPIKKVEIPVSEWHDDWAKGNVPTNGFDEKAFTSAAFILSTRDGVPSNPFPVQFKAPSLADLVEVPAGIVVIRLKRLLTDSWYDIGTDCTLKVTLETGMDKIANSPNPYAINPMSMYLYWSEEFSPSKHHTYLLPTDHEVKSHPDHLLEQWYQPLLVLPLRPETWIRLTATGYDEEDVDGSGTLELRGPYFGLETGQSSQTMRIKAKNDYTFDVEVGIEVLDVRNALLGNLPQPDPSRPLEVINVLAGMTVDGLKELASDLAVKALKNAFGLS